MFRDDPFWGNNEVATSHNLIELIDLIEDDITVKLLPFAKDINNKISIPQFELSDRPSDETIKKMQSLHGGYEINIFKRQIKNLKFYITYIIPIKIFNHFINNYYTFCVNFILINSQK